MTELEWKLATTIRQISQGAIDGRTKVLCDVALKYLERTITNDLTTMEKQHVDWTRRRKAETSQTATWDGRRVNKRVTATGPGATTTSHEVS